MSTLYETIYKELLGKIQSGELAAGVRVPTEKELAEEYDVSRITTKKALDMLRNDGYISRTPGRGSFVCVKSTEPISSENVLAEKKKMIGLIIEDFAENFGAFIISGVERACSKAGYVFVFKRTFGSQEAEKSIINEFREMGVEGLLIMPVHGDSYNEAILQLALDHFPTVLLDRQLKGMPLSYVGTDNFAAAKMLADYLFSAGHKQICFISPAAEDTSSVANRISGFVKSSEEHGILPEKYIFTEVRGTLPKKTPEETLALDEKAICDYLRATPEVTGILAVEYNIALTTLHAIESMGKRVPEDYEIVCFDGPENYIGRYEFTHARQAEEEIGATGVKLLLEQIQGKDKVVHIEMPATIKERYKR